MSLDGAVSPWEVLVASRVAIFRGAGEDASLIAEEACGMTCVMATSSEGVDAVTSFFEVCFEYLHEVVGKL